MIKPLPRSAFQLEELQRKYVDEREFFAQYPTSTVFE